MSWFFKSLQSDDPGDCQLSSSSSPEQPQQESPTDGGGGVNEGLSVIGESLGRQLRGIAYFLAPPPSPPSTTDNMSDFFPSTASPQSQALLGIRNDLAEIGGSLKSGLSLLSSNKAVSEISKFTSTFLQFQSNSSESRDDENDNVYEDDYDYVPGITDEVIDFVKEISLRPECWTDFPLSLESAFTMSDAQREHVSAIECMVPSLTALRANLHSHMEDEQFWMIYFILLLPRMNEQDFEVLSTPEILETRNLLLQKLQNKRNMNTGTSENSAPHASQDGSKLNERLEDNILHNGKEFTEIVNETGKLGIDDTENADQWLKETQVDSGTSLDGKKMLDHEEDVSFSDLEDDDHNLTSRQSGSRQAQGIVRAPSPTGSSDWVQLNESSETQGGLQKTRQSISREKDSDGESNDWLKVDDFD